jgi:hypothetical protein
MNSDHWWIGIIFNLTVQNCYTDAVYADPDEKIIRLIPTEKGREMEPSNVEAQYNYF